MSDIVTRFEVHGSTADECATRAREIAAAFFGDNYFEIAGMDVRPHVMIAQGPVSWEASVTAVALEVSL